jgi:hypothetical protein
MLHDTTLMILLGTFAAGTLYLYNRQGSDAKEVVDIRDEKLLKSKGDIPQNVDVEKVHRTGAAEAKLFYHRLTSQLLKGAAKDMANQMGLGKNEVSGNYSDLMGWMNNALGSSQVDSAVRSITVDGVREYGRQTIFRKVDFSVEPIPYLEGDNLFVNIAHTFGFLVPKADLLRIILSLDFLLMSVVEVATSPDQLALLKVEIIKFIKVTFNSLQGQSASSSNFLSYKMTAFVESGETSLVKLAEDISEQGRIKYSMGDYITDENLTKLCDDIVKPYVDSAANMKTEGDYSKAEFQGYYQAAVQVELMEDRGFDFVQAHAYYTGMEQKARNEIFLARARQFSDKLGDVGGESIIDLTENAFNYLNSLPEKEAQRAREIMAEDYDQLLLKMGDLEHDDY